MATKTVVCPECGATAAPGRYACAECGALLAAVAVTPRTWSAAEGDEIRPDRGGSDPAPDAAASLEPVAVAPPSEPVDEPLAEVRSVPTPVAADAPVAAEHDPASLAFDEDAPIGSAAGDRAFQPDVLHDLPDSAEAEADGLGSEPGSAEPDDPEPHDGSPIDVEPGPLALDDAPPVAPAAFADVPTWPPAGDRGPIARPEPRTPAGSYLPPSAVLPPLDGVAAPALAAAPTAAGSAGTWASRGSAALADVLDGVRLTADGSRRAIVLGAGLAALGMLLPWINGPLNEGAFAGYVDRWGLAGSGMWLVFLALGGLAFVAGSVATTSRLPVGFLGLSLGAFVLGLLWPYLIGNVGRSVGVWVVLAGAIVLAVGGALDRRDRHASDVPDVPRGDAGGR